MTCFPTVTPGECFYLGFERSLAGNALRLEIAASVELEITETEPGLQGDRSTGGRKPATLQTGKVVQVPLFINIGDRVKVDTRTGEYMTRV